MTGVQKCALRSEEHTSELQSHDNLVCRLLLEKKKQQPRARPAQPHPAHPPTQPHTLRAPRSARPLEVPSGEAGRAHEDAGCACVFFLNSGAPPGSTSFPPTGPSQV